MDVSIYSTYWISVKRELLDDKTSIYPSSQSGHITRWINKKPVQSLKTKESLTGVTVSHTVNANFQLKGDRNNWIPIMQDNNNILTI